MLTTSYTCQLQVQQEDENSRDSDTLVYLLIALHNVSYNIANKLYNAIVSERGPIKRKGIVKLFGLPVLSCDIFGKTRRKVK